MEKLKDRVPFWFVAAVLMFFAWLQIALNPFGFSDLTQRYSQDVSNLLITGPYLYPTTGRDKISVVVVDEPSLFDMQQPWQWSYSQHARALDAILDFRPKAVIVDFLFVDQHPDDTIGELVDEIRRYQKRGVPIYFEGGINLPFGQIALRPELARTGVPILDPTIIRYDGVVRQYPTTGHCYGPDGKEKKGQQCLSAALQVYGDLYGSNYSPELLDGKMELVWGTKTAPFNVMFNERSGSPPCNQDAGFLLRTYRAFFDRKSAEGLCPYNNYVPAELPITQPNDHDLPGVIPGHIVFYGGNLQGAQDTSYTPTSGQQANVFVHAMALDNLISFHGRPYQNMMRAFGRTISNEPAQIMAIIPVILILSFLHMRRVRARKAKPAAHDEEEHDAIWEWFAEKGAENFWHWFGFFLGLSIGLLLALWVGLSVANWVEVVFISVELAAMTLIGLPDSFWGYLHHVAGGVPDDSHLEETA